jgi:hypothetical protein
MKQSNLPDYSGQPCKSIITENIRAVEKGKELTAPLSYLNKSCEFRTAYKRIVGEFEKMDKEEVKAHHKAHQKAYYQRPEVKAHQKAYYQRPEVKARKKMLRKLREGKE